MYAAFSLSPLFLAPLLPVQMPVHIGSLEQCQCVVGMLQVMLGFLVPFALHIVWESSEYIAYRRRHPAGNDASGLMHWMYVWVWETTEAATCFTFGVVALHALAAAWLAIVASAAPAPR
jgi:TRAP-type mannitol/chloroaromatic compound transport system permease small subunit